MQIGDSVTFSCLLVKLPCNQFKIPILDQLNSFEILHYSFQEQIIETKNEINLPLNNVFICLLTLGWV